MVAERLVQQLNRNGSFRAHVTTLRRKYIGGDLRWRSGGEGLKADGVYRPEVGSTTIVAVRAHGLEHSSSTASIGTVERTQLELISVAVTHWRHATARSANLFHLLSCLLLSVSCLRFANDELHISRKLFKVFKL